MLTPPSLERGDNELPERKRGDNEFSEPERGDNEPAFGELKL